MVRGGISAKRKPDLSFIAAIMNKEKYMKVLKKFLYSFLKEADGTGKRDFDYERYVRCP